MLGKFKLAVVLAAVDRLTPFLNQAEGKVARFGRAAESIGKKLTVGVSAPIAGFFALAFKHGLEAQKAMKGLGFATGATADELLRAREAMEKLGGPFTTPETADAVKLLTQRGLSLKEAMTAIVPAIDLATAANTELTAASEAAVSVMRSFNLQAGDIPRVANLIGIANLKAGVSVEEFAAELALVSPLAAEAGHSLEATAATLIDLRRHGQDAGPALRAAIAALLAPSKEALKAFAKLKIKKGDVFDSSGQMHELADVMKLLSDRGATAADMFAIFSKRAGRALISELQTAGASIEDINLLFADNAFTTKAAAKNMEGFAGQMKTIRKAFDLLLERVAKPEFLKAVTNLANRLADFVEQIAKLPQPVIDVGVGLSVLALAAGPAIYSFTKLTGLAIALKNALFGVAAAEAAASGGGAAGAAGGLLGKARGLLGLAGWAGALGYLSSTGGNEGFAEESEKRFYRVMGIPVPGRDDPGRMALSRMQQTAAAPVSGSAQVTVRLENKTGIPSRVTSSRARGVDLDVDNIDMGWAMSPQ